MTLQRRVPPELQKLFDEHDRQVAEWDYQDAVREQKLRERQRESGVIRKTYDGSNRPAQQPVQHIQIDNRGWNRWADEKIADALAAERAKISDAIAKTISFMRREWNDSIAKELSALEEKLRNEIISEVGSLRADLTVERTLDRNNIVDLPNPLRTRKSDAA